MKTKTIVDDVLLIQPSEKKANKSIKTLTMNQLLERWSRKLSKENILELADQCCFGAYVKPMRNRKTYCDIDSFVANPNCDELKNRLQQFKKNHPYLLDSKLGYERLATTSEAELYQLCKSTAIAQFLEKGEILPSEYNNTFGIKKEENKYICCSYLFMRMPCVAINERFQNKIFTYDDLFFFIDQIERYEEQEFMQVGEDASLHRSLVPSKLNSSDDNSAFISDHKPKQKRHCALHELIHVIHNKATDKSAAAIWKELKELEDTDHDVIEKISSWTSNNAEIVWCNQAGKQQTTKKSTFQNIISKLNRSK